MGQSISVSLHEDYSQWPKHKMGNAVLKWRITSTIKYRSHYFNMYSSESHVPFQDKYP